MKPITAFALLSGMLLSSLAFSKPQKIERVDEAELREPVRVEEVSELRERNADTYLLSDGSYECVVYSENKYYKNERVSLPR